MAGSVRRVYHWQTALSRGYVAGYLEQGYLEQAFPWNDRQAGAKVLPSPRIQHLDLATASNTNKTPALLRPIRKSHCENPRESVPESWDFERIRDVRTVIKSDGRQRIR